MGRLNLLNELPAGELTPVGGLHVERVSKVPGGVILRLVEGVEVPEAEFKVVTLHLLESKLYPESADVVDYLADEVALPGG